MYEPIDGAQLETVTGGFQFKKLATAAGVGLTAGAAGGSVACLPALAGGFSYPLCVASSAAGGAISASVWNTANQLGLL